MHVAEVIATVDEVDIKFLEPAASLPCEPVLVQQIAHKSDRAHFADQGRVETDLVQPVLNGGGGAGCPGAVEWVEKDQKDVARGI